MCDLGSHTYIIGSIRNKQLLEEVESAVNEEEEGKALGLNSNLFLSAVRRKIYYVRLFSQIRISKLKISVHETFVGFGM